MFAYLEDWVPPGEGEAPPPDALFPVTPSAGRLEIAASVPSEAERDEALKRALHEQLKPKVADLARLAGNRFARLAGRARSLSDRLDRPFEELDMVLIHLDVEEIKTSFDRRAERTGEDAYTADVVDALSDVAAAGPGLTLDNPDVEILEQRKRRFAGQPPDPDAQAAHDAMSAVVAKDDKAFGDRLRALEERMPERMAEISTPVIQRAAHRNIFWRIGVSVVLAGGSLGIGVAGNIIADLHGPAIVDFLASNWPAVVQVASSYGGAFLDWFLTSVAPIPELSALVARTRKKK